MSGVSSHLTGDGEGDFHVILSGDGDKYAPFHGILAGVHCDFVRWLSPPHSIFLSDAHSVIEKMLTKIYV